MIGVQFKTITYLALNGRRYLSIRAAANACARVRIESKYPTEAAEYEQGRMTYPRFHYSETDWGKKMHRKLTKLYAKRYKWLAKNG